MSRVAAVWSGGLARPAMIAAMLLLSACLGGAGRDPATQVAFFRNTTAPIATVRALDHAAFSGFWNIRAAFAYPGQELFRAGIDFQTGAGGDIVQLVMHGIKRGGAFGVTDIYPVTAPKPGRFVFGDPPYATEYSVLWVDPGYQSAAIGTKSGSFGWIIDRSRSGGAERMAQAHAALRAAGYDMTRLEDLP